MACANSCVASATSSAYSRASRCARRARATSPPFREAEFEILYGKGISREGELIDMGALHGLVEKSGSWYAYEGERIGQGKDNARTYLIDHPEIAAKIDAALRARLMPVRRPVAVPSEAAEA